MLFDAVCTVVAFASLNTIEIRLVRCAQSAHVLQDPQQRRPSSWGALLKRPSFRCKTHPTALVLPKWLLPDLFSHFSLKISLVQMVASTPCVSGCSCVVFSAKVGSLTVEIVPIAKDPST